MDNSMNSQTPINPRYMQGAQNAQNSSETQGNSSGPQTYTGPGFAQQPAQGHQGQGYSTQGYPSQGYPRPPQGSPYAAPQSSPQNSSQGAYPRVNYPPMYSGPIVQSRVQVIFHDRYVYNNEPNIVVAVLSIVGMIIAGLTIAGLYTFPDWVMTSDSLMLTIVLATLIIAGSAFIIAGVVSYIRLKKIKNSKQGSDTAEQSYAQPAQSVHNEQAVHNEQTAETTQFATPQATQYSVKQSGEQDTQTEKFARMNSDVLDDSDDANLPPTTEFATETIDMSVQENDSDK